MADLRSSTMIGGSVVWTASNLPVTPASNTLLYKTYKVYTEHDKPTAAELNVVSKAGDTMTGDLTAPHVIATTSMTAPSFIGALTGNATTATKWTTSRTITLTGDVTGSVTGVDGSGNISINTVANNATTADTFTTARTITIGNTGKTFNGSANVSWSLAEIGALPLSGGTMVGTITTRTPDIVTTTTGVTGMTFAAGAPIVIREVNVGTSDSFIPAIMQTATYSSGYRVVLKTGLFRQGSNNWGVGQTGYFVALGGNDNYPTEYFRMLLGGDIYHSSGNNFLHSNNYNNYAPTLTGTGAYGIWNIATTGAVYNPYPGQIMLTGGTNNTATILAAYSNTIYFRPNGYSSVTNQATLSTSGVLTAPTFSGALSGNATTATTLAAARTLTIGNTGKTFNGSADISWSLSELGAASLAGSDAITGAWSFTSTTLTLSSHFFHRMYDTNNTYEHYYPPGGNGTNTSVANLRVWDGAGSYKALVFSGDGAFNWNGYPVLTSANYNSYAPTLTGTGASGTWNINVTGYSASTAKLAPTYGVSDLNTLYSSGTFSWINTSTGIPVANSYGMGLAIVSRGTDYNGTDNWITQIGFSTGNYAGYRTKVNTGAWSAWKQFLDSSNYNSFSPTLTGTGASGTWAINATGYSTWVSLSNGGNVSVTGASHSTINVGGYAKGGYYGVALNNDAQIMYNGTAFGCYFGSIGNWAWYANKGAETNIHYAGSTKLATTSSGVTITGTATATTFIGALSGNATTATTATTAGTCTGNAATATTLATARTINGTSFNGSANITTANWGTARTITVGNTAKSVNGSANVSWSLAEIGAPSTTGAGASGTWGISISGNAASATTATRASTVTIDYNNNTNSTYQMLWGSSTSVFGTAGIYCNPSTNTVYATTFSGALSGNATTATTASTATTATTATTLATARTINGTSFNGSANITTANWGATRTITIGNTAKSINGSANVAWSLAEIGASASIHSHTGKMTFTLLLGTAVAQGNFTLSAPYSNFDGLVVIAGGDDSSYAAMSFLPTDMLNAVRSLGLDVCLLQSNGINFRGYFSSNNQTFVTTSENAKVHRIYGYKYTVS